MNTFMGFISLDKNSQVAVTGGLFKPLMPPLYPVSDCETSHFLRIRLQIVGSIDSA